MLEGETCWTMIRDAASGDDEARTRFTAMYYDAIERFMGARWRKSKLSAEAPDAAQDVLLECIRGDGVLARANSEHGEFRALLYTVCRNVARRYEARWRVGQATAEDASWMDEVASDEIGQSALFDRSWAQAIVRRAAALQRERACEEGEEGLRRVDLLDRRFTNGEPIRDIAQAWGMPSQSVHNLYRKARGEFQACLREVVKRHANTTTDLDGECRRLLGLL